VRAKKSRQVPASERLACLRCRGVFRAPAERCPLDGARLHRGGRDPLLGTWFAGRYLVEELVGDGPLGRIYRARDMVQRRSLALRVLAGERAADPVARSRFQRQAELARRLDHPNVVPVADLGTSREGLPFVVTDYVSGHALSQIVAREGPFERDRAAEILRQVASGLAHAHERGVLHRDLRPANVLLSRERRRRERARIVDFGIGGAEGDAGRDVASLAALVREMVGGVTTGSDGAARHPDPPAAGTADLGQLARRLEEPKACLRSLGLTGAEPAGRGSPRTRSG
jgi:eukaryotic-like serine/threonine-protein kinase